MGNFNCNDPPRKIYHTILRAIMQVEVFMAAAAVLLFFQLVCGSLRRRSNNPFIQRGLWVSYTLLPPLVTYTLGLMQSSQVVAVIMYPVWALSLFLIAGGANSITAYELNDNRQWKRGLLDILQYDIYFGIVIFQLLYTDHSIEDGRVERTKQMPILHRIRRQFLIHPTILPVFILFTAVCFAHTFRTIASWMVNYSYPSKVVADYMKDYANSRLGGGDHSKEDSFDPVTMKGCKYMVHWPAYKVTGTWNGKSCLYRCEPVPKDGVVTVAMIWDERNEEKLVSYGLSSSRIKVACLSYSLSHLLRRRFFGMDCAEASLPETRRFVLEGLLSDKNNANGEYTEAFTVIEVELAFLYDFFYTRYALIFGMEGLFFLMVMVKIVCSFGLGAVMLYSSLSERHSVADQAQYILDEYYTIIIRLNVTRVSVTVAVIGAFLVVEALQFILYLGSDWAMVSLACCSLTGRGRSDGFIPFALRKGCGLFISKRKLPLFGYWQNKLGQYSVIQGSKFFSLRKDFAFESNTLSMFIFSKAIAYLGQSLGNLFSTKGLHFVKLPDKLKPQIVSILKSSEDGHLSNGKASLQRNGFLQQFSWTLQNETQTESMLIWHIATDYCRIICDSAELRSMQLPCCYDNHEVATKLSCYCAYLMSNVPKLLPGNSIDTRSIFDEVMYKAREALGTNARDRDGLQKALSCSGVDNSIFIKGLKLGTDLEAIQDTSLRWKVMAEFWAETILYIAPSNNVNAHMERLAQGGEFLTHLWALLTHAGILNRDQEPTLAEGEGLA